MSKLSAREVLEYVRGVDATLHGYTARRGNLSELAARVEKVLTLHSRSKFFTHGICVECSGVTPHKWPCPTIRLLNGEDV